ncbi:MAG: DNA polymerase III subunit alpha [Bacteroidetes bacterium]|nr:DNA polymerase III subunit alpha [Bacteroidota bacterium]
MYLIFDTETTGLPRNWNAPITDTDNWPRCVQIAWQLHDDMGRLVEHKDYLIRPEGYNIPYDAERVHGISTELAEEQGVDLLMVLEDFNRALSLCKFVVGQNLGFDLKIMGCELHRKNVQSPLLEKPVLDTCTELTAEMCQLPGGRGGKFKLPTLTELHFHLFQQKFEEAHNATADVEATTRCFFELLRLGSFPAQLLQAPASYLEAFQTFNTSAIALAGLKHVNLKEASEKVKKQKSKGEVVEEKEIDSSVLIDVPFSHLHNHTQYSILQSTTEVEDLVKKAADMNMPAVALTDLGNMMAAFDFVSALKKHNDNIAKQKKEAEEKGEPFNKIPLKGIVGCEFHLCKDRKNKTVKDNGYQIPMIAKNKKGYHNLAKLSSSGFIEGSYYVPRIDRDILLQLKSDIIVFTGGLKGEIADLILNVGERQAEEAFLWWKEQFGDDFYAQLTRHGLEEENRVNDTLLKFCKAHGVKYFAANETFYLNKEDANAHDILLCVKEGEKKSTPIGRGRGFRYGFPNDEYYFKSTEEMKMLFKDLPEAIITTNEIVEKIESYKLAADVLLPKFEIPEEFKNPDDVTDGGKRGENAYLLHLTNVGAQKRYGEVTPEIQERLTFELDTISKSGYPGYFLIVQDFIAKAREMGVSVGPGRGSAAGSAVAYCTGITNVDPIKYDLLFERFLNPERVSLPDIDIDFDDEGRQKVIDYVINKYGSSQVAQIITYGTMAAKSSIRDTGRVLDLPLFDTDRISKLVPNMKLNKLFGMDEKQLKEALNGDEVEMAKRLKEIYLKDDLEGQTLRQARILEGSVRNTGIHACGVIITPSDIRELLPVATAKDSEMWCTQFDNSVVESAGLLKMDFLGLKTLTLIKDAIVIIKDRHGIQIDIDEIPLDDELTYKLFQKGETVGIFQYESPGMQKHMKDLKPTVFADLIAMNALYRPGPIEYIPSFIKRKHGVEEITYDLADMEEYLKETYGITVYQEQVMLLSQKLAGFTKGEADVLRKAMGKKQRDVLDKMRPKFIEKGKAKGHAEDKLAKIWKDWEAFAAYAFNKSHSTCYALIAYQTAYLKAHYPAEYMASVLSNNMNNISEVTFFMEECMRMGTPVLGPDVNESVYKFTVNSAGAIRFGLGAIKGVGEGAVESIVEERRKGGVYKNIFDMTKRINLRAANKKCMENLVLAGGFDCFKGTHRAQYFFKANEKDSTFLEKAIKYGTQSKSDEDSNQQSLFGSESAVDLPVPPIPRCEEWSNIQALNQEKEVVGIFISGHPLNDFRLEIDNFVNSSFQQVNEDIVKFKNRDLSFAGVVTEVSEKVSKNGNHFGILAMEDYTASYKFFLFGEDYLKYRRYLVMGSYLYLKTKVQPRKFNQDEMELKVNNIELLSDLREKLVKSITLKLDIKNLTEKYLEDLSLLFDKHPGTCRVKLNVVDPIEKISVEMPSRTKKVNLNNDFITDVKNKFDMDLKIN